MHYSASLTQKVKNKRYDIGRRMRQVTNDESITNQGKRKWLDSPAPHRVDKRAHFYIMRHCWCAVLKRSSSVDVSIVLLKWRHTKSPLVGTSKCCRYKRRRCVYRITVGLRMDPPARERNSVRSLSLASSLWLVYDKKLFRWSSATIITQIWRSFCVKSSRDSQP